MPRKNPLKTSGIMEGVFLPALFGPAIYLLTKTPGALYKIIVSGLIIFAGFIFSLKSKNPRSRDLWKTTAALGAGFWIFTLFRYLRFVSWPLGKAGSINECLGLVLFHVVFVLCIFVPLLWICGKKTLERGMEWGNWGALSPGWKGRKLFGGILLVAVIWTVWMIVRTPHSGGRIAYLFFPAAIIKGFLTAGGEEVSFRGVLQKAAVSRYGAAWGILLQAVLYTVFHLNLGPAIFPFPFFIASVFLLGIVFGYVTYKIGGIGWAFTVHFLIDLVIEWQHLS